MRQFINIVESASPAEALFKRYGGQIMPFDELPESAQKALAHYEHVDGAEYAAETQFGYVVLPAKELIKLCWNAPHNDMQDDFASWREYAEWYWSSEDESNYANHLTEMWPVILDDGEGVLDGWHRLHWYLRNGVKEIPAILFV